MSEKEIKLECLKIAITLGFDTYDLAIAKAKDLYEFISSSK
jgi:hypothetical protein